METTHPIADFADAVRARSSAYEEEAAARIALDEAQRRLTGADRDLRWDSGRDPVMAATLRGRIAIAKLRVEEARTRLAEARRDLNMARKLSGNAEE